MSESFDTEVSRMAGDAQSYDAEVSRMAGAESYGAEVSTMAQGVENHNANLGHSPSQSYIYTAWYSPQQVGYDDNAHRMIYGSVVTYPRLSHDEGL